MTSKVCLARQLLFLGALSLLLSGCPAMLSGRVTTIAETPPPQQSLFMVISQNSASLRERVIVELIEKKMSERGFLKASSPELAKVTVHYKYSIGPSRTDVSVSSSPDFVYGGKQVSSSSSTTYPRTFEIAVMGNVKSKVSGKIEIIWLGEVYSSGSSADMTLLAPNFIDILFENYGKTVTNQKFSRQINW
ncbi:MAG: hypothetical protein HZB34_12840 [Nitrospirae bacterium]|nr:hypothetical protein [Nitrospirota bacterium]